METKVIGYGVALLGLFILVVGAGTFGFSVPGDPWIVNVVAMVCVGLGVVLVVMNSSGGGRRGSKYDGKRKNKDKKKLDDLPIYEGENIVAYRRD